MALGDAVIIFRPVGFLGFNADEVGGAVFDFLDKFFLINQNQI